MRTLGLILVAALVAGLATTPSVAARAPAYELLSVTSKEKPANGWTFDATVSRTGRYVAFVSQATNLGSGPPAAIALRDRKRGTTTSPARATDGHLVEVAYQPALSPNGRYLAFCSWDPTVVKPDSFDWVSRDAHVDVFVRDLRAKVTRRASTTWKGKEADGWSCYPQVADNGDTAFSSQATNLLKRRFDDQGEHAFVYDWSSKRLRALGQGGLGAAISTDARYVAWNVGNEIDLLDRDTGRRRTLVEACTGTAYLDDHGRYALVTCPGTRLERIEVRTGRRILLNPYVGPPGPIQGSPLMEAMSGDGRTVAFVGQPGSYGGLPADDQAVYVWRQGHGLRNLTPGADDTWTDSSLDLSGDGSFVVFTTDSRTISDQDPEDPIEGPPQVDLFGVRVSGAAAGASGG